MGYPTVPNLQPFKACQRPNLMAHGQYDVTLTEIEEYLKLLGEYVDTQDLALQEQIDAHNLRITMLEDRMDSAESRLDSAENRLDSAETRLDTAETNITDLHERVTYIEENPYVLPEAAPEVLGGVYTVTDSDFYEYVGMEVAEDSEAA